jgi:trans-2,3-dihydro-3-hydroxyanthranilate isomerase
VRRYRILQVDVFTGCVLAGNQLGVVPDARGLSDEEMQAIAREMNVAETTFVLPSTRPDCVARVRIFTPGPELPFAGHPTIGTAWVLATESLVPAGAARFALDEKIGPVEVELDGDPARPSFVWMKHRDATFSEETKDRAAVAGALGLAESDLLPGAPVVTGSTGNAFFYVPLRDRETVDRAVADARRLADVMLDPATIGAMVLAPDPDRAARRVYTRMFAPGSGVPEDPATGSAAGALGAYLLIHGLVAPAAEMLIVSEQGTKMGRQSLLHVALTLRDGTVRDIRVGGSTVPALDGTLTLP